MPSEFDFLEVVCVFLSLPRETWLFLFKARKFLQTYPGLWRLHWKRGVLDRPWEKRKPTESVL